MRHRPTPKSTAFWTSAFVVAFVGAGGWLGCSNNGDASIPSAEPAESTSGTTEEGNDRPEFEAGFDDQPDGSTDPTPPNSDQCIDKDDPGSSESVAKELGTISDCDDNAKVVEGVSAGAVDVDFYKFSLKDENLCIVEPNIESPTSGLEMCVFARCKQSTANAVTGCEEGTEITSEIGLKGCCTTTPGKAIPEWDCDGNFEDDSADFFVRIKQVTGGEKCLPYKFSYGF